LPFEPKKESREHAPGFTVPVDQTSFPVADYPQNASAPFIFTTGYGDSGFIPERFADAPIARKPYTLKTLGAAIDLCLSTRRRNA